LQYFKGIVNPKIKFHPHVVKNQYAFLSSAEHILKNDGNQTVLVPTAIQRTPKGFETFLKNK